MATRAPKHCSIAVIPVTEAEKGSCEKPVPRESGASVNLCVILRQHRREQVVLALVIHNCHASGDAGPKQAQLYCQKDHDAPFYCSRLGVCLTNTGEELLLKVIQQVSCKCAPQGQVFPAVRSFGL